MYKKKIDEKVVNKIDDEIVDKIDDKFIEDKPIKKESKNHLDIVKKIKIPNGFILKIKNKKGKTEIVRKQN